MGLNSVIKTLFIIIGITAYLPDLKACECIDQPLILDLYSSDVVFTGTIVEKSYSTDSTHYTITFKADHYYKDTEQRRGFQKFTKVSEFEFSEQWTSCDFHLNVGDKWLIVAFYKGDEITFGYCSASRIIDTDSLDSKTLRLLEHMDQFDVSQYRFSSNLGFTKTKPLINLDSLAASVGTTPFKDRTQLVIFDIDQQGKLTAANFRSKTKPKLVNNDFGLYYFQNIEDTPPKDKFEMVILETARKITKWNPKTHLKSGEAVLSRASAFFSTDENGKLIIEF